METAAAKKTRLDRERQKRIDDRQKIKDQQETDRKAGKTGGTKRKAKGEGRSGTKKAPRRGTKNGAADSEEADDAPVEEEPGDGGDTAENDGGVLEEGPEPGDQQPLEDEREMPPKDKAIDLETARITIRETLVEADIEDKDRFLQRYDLVCDWFGRFAEAGIFLRVPDRTSAQNHEQWLTRLERAVVSNRPSHWDKASQEQQQQCIPLQWLDARFRLPDLERGNSYFEHDVRLLKCYDKWRKAFEAAGMWVPVPPAINEAVDQYLDILRQAIHPQKDRLWSIPTQRETWLQLWADETATMSLRADPGLNVRQLVAMFLPLQKELQRFAKRADILPPPLPEADEAVQEYWDRLDGLIEVERHLVWPAGGPRAALSSWIRAGAAIAKDFFHHAEYRNTLISHDLLVQWILLFHNSILPIYVAATLPLPLDTPDAYIARLRRLIAPHRMTYWTSAGEADQRIYVKRRWIDARADVIKATAGHSRKDHIVKSFNLRKGWAETLSEAGHHLPNPPIYGSQESFGEYFQQLDKALDDLTAPRWESKSPNQKRFYVDRRWHDAVTDLYMSEQEARDDAIVSLERHHRWANHLAASEIYLESPPIWYENEDLDAYMARVSAMVGPAKQDFYKAWLSLTDGVTKAEDYESRLIHKRVLCLSGDHTPLGNNPPVLCRCQSENASDRASTLAWKVISTKLASQAPSRDAQMRLAALEHFAEEDRELYDELIWPPLWTEGTPHHEYLAALGQTIFDTRRRFLLAAWTSEIDRAEANGDSEQAKTLRANSREAQALYKNYRRRWRPPQTAPPPAIGLDDYKGRTDALGFDNARSGIAGTWQYKGQVGKGAFGFASIWVKFNDDDLPVDRIVIKQVELRPRMDGEGKPTADRWNMSFSWLGDPKDRMPLDYGLVKPLNDLPYSENIIRVDSYAVYDMQRTFRVYLEYCEHGDLRDVIDLYKEHRDENTKNKSNGHLPIRVLWSLFEAFASVMCLMNHGQLPDGPPAPVTARWQAMIHRDIKPENIFLAKSHSTNWPSVPIPKLADFGLGILQSDPKAVLPGAGTPICKAPEQYDYNEEVPPQPDLNEHPVSHKSDVWAIGKLMINLINIQHGNEKNYIKGKYNEDWEPNRLVTPGAQKFYEDCESWPNLQDLLQHCLQPDPANRPNGMDLLGEIREEVERDCGEPSMPMRLAPAAHLGMELKLWREDRYKEWATALET